MSESKQNYNPALFFGGLIVGTLITAMLTPRSGREIREKLKTRASEMSDSMKNTAKDIKETAAETTEQVAGEVQKSAKKAQDTPQKPPATKS